MTITRANLDDNGLRIERMWREGAPRQVAEMEARGSFYAHILSLQQQEERIYTEMVAAGKSHEAITEAVTALVAPPLDWQP
jgi:hypothetical protein